ncbi:hypothetical protein Naga_100169g19, partial [Nannochloropsis gaditana]
YGDYYSSAGYSQHPHYGSYPSQHGSAYSDYPPSGVAGGLLLLLRAWGVRPERQRPCGGGSASALHGRGGVWRLQWEPRLALSGPRRAFIGLCSGWGGRIRATPRPACAPGASRAESPPLLGMGGGGEGISR